MSRKLRLIVFIIMLSTICSIGIIYNLKDINTNILSFGESDLNIVGKKGKNRSSDKKEKEKEFKSVSWDLQSIYNSDEDWEKELNKFNKDIKELKNYIGKVTKSNLHFSSALKIKEKLDIREQRLYSYVKLKRDINKGSYKYLDMIDKLKKVDCEYSKVCSKFELEILKLDDETYNDYLENKTINKKYKTYLESIRKNKKYYLDSKSEDLLSRLGDLTTLPSNIYDLFRNMDKNNLSSSSDYSNQIKSYDRNVRKEAYTNEFGAYNENINTLSGLLIAQVKKNNFFSEIRGYDSSLDMYLKDDEVSPKVYNNLIDIVGKNTGSLHEYISLRKKILKVDKFNYYDMFVPITKKFNTDISYEKAMSIIYAALSPLGEEYEDIVYKAFNENWIDVYSNKDKVDGGYCLSVYKNHPYIFLNYDNSIDSVSTLAHELGHGVYEYLSQKNQSFYNSSPTILTHEIASTTNEALLYEYLIKNSEDKEAKIYYITKYLDFIKDTLYTQTMYAEFEKEIHDLVENNQNINALVLNDLWSKLLTKYYGKDFDVDYLAMVGWARIPHFYNSFYVYKYATGCSSAISFSKDIKKNGSKNYMEFLKKGASEKPLKLLKDSNIDLNNEKTIQVALDKFDDLLKQLETLTNN